mmetsp:Transcript_153800/g.269030  ORF Transcript_153800/g.269030 Transcript_153800/m.269030 type:complete len:879 (-) Transcript_153800:277-2913(-)
MDVVVPNIPQGSTVARAKGTAKVSSRREFSPRGGLSNRTTGSNPSSRKSSVRLPSAPELLEHRVVVGVPLSKEEMEILRLWQAGLTMAETQRSMSTLRRRRLHHRVPPTAKAPHRTPPAPPPGDSESPVDGDPPVPPPPPLPELEPLLGRNPQRLDTLLGKLETKCTAAAPGLPRRSPKRRQSVAHSIPSTRTPISRMSCVPTYRRLHGRATQLSGVTELLNQQETGLTAEKWLAAVEAEDDALDPEASQAGFEAGFQEEISDLIQRVEDLKGRSQPRRPSTPQPTSASLQPAAAVANDPEDRHCPSSTDKEDPVKPRNLRKLKSFSRATGTIVRMQKLAARYNEPKLTIDTTPIPTTLVQGPEGAAPGTAPKPDPLTDPSLTTNPDVPHPSLVAVAGRNNPIAAAAAAGLRRSTSNPNIGSGVQRQDLPGRPVSAGAASSRALAPVALGGDYLQRLADKKRAWSQRQQERAERTQKRRQAEEKRYMEHKLSLAELLDQKTEKAETRRGQWLRNIAESQAIWLRVAQTVNVWQRLYATLVNGREEYWRQRQQDESLRKIQMNLQWTLAVARWRKKKRAEGHVLRCIWAWAKWRRRQKTVRAISICHWVIRAIGKQSSFFRAVRKTLSTVRYLQSIIRGCLRLRRAQLQTVIQAYRQYEVHVLYTCVSAGQQADLLRQKVAKLVASKAVDYLEASRTKSPRKADRTPLQYGRFLVDRDGPISLPAESVQHLTEAQAERYRLRQLARLDMKALTDFEVLVHAEDLGLLPRKELTDPEEVHRVCADYLLKILKSHARKMAAWQMVTGLSAARQTLRRERAGHIVLLEDGTLEARKTLIPSPPTSPLHPKPRLKLLPAPESLLHLINDARFAQGWRYTNLEH